LFGSGHVTENQFLCDQALDQPFGVGEIILAPSRSAIGLGLSQVQASGQFAGSLPVLALGLPLLFQHAPHWLPVLSCGFHHYLFDLLGVQPVGQFPQ
jgi:hypothetical protein